MNLQITAGMPVAWLRKIRAKAPYPEQVVLDWTDYCNAKCFFCPRDEYEKQIGGKGSFIPLESLKRLENVLREVKYFSISSAIGEPLLHPELKEILDWLYAINPSILLRTVTNGTPLTAAKASWLAGHLDWLSISLNAADGESHMRDMFPHLAAAGTNAENRWQLHLRHLAEFIAALPPEDRPRIRLQMVTHKHNAKDMADFVRLTHKLGASQAVITNIRVQDQTIASSLLWIKDQYNDLVEEACDVGAQLGVQVHACRFYTSVKPALDLDRVCREPIDIAYISRSIEAAPCCHWGEAKFPVDIYNDTDGGFDRYWNNDVLARLRKKRDFESCRVCGLARVFDETSFHYSLDFKQKLIAKGGLPEADSANDYPSANLVRICVNNRLDLPSIRRTLLAFGLPVEMADQIETHGLVAALPVLEKACWEAFRTIDTPVSKNDIALARSFFGIGWGPPIFEPRKKASARWISDAQVASIFLRVTAGRSFEVRFTIHSVHHREFATSIKMQINCQSIETVLSTDRLGRTVVSAIVPDDLSLAHDGRLWIRIECASPKMPRAEQVSLTRLEIKESGWLSTLSVEERLSEQDTLIAHQRERLAEQERFIAHLQNSRSWRVTSPLRKVTTAIRRWRSRYTRR
jgi:MoaA/NifB/PqqE/SkfB family radical SAM enzyme